MYEVSLETVENWEVARATNVLPRGGFHGNDLINAHKQIFHEHLRIMAIQCMKFYWNLLKTVEVVRATIILERRCFIATPFPTFTKNKSCTSTLHDDQVYDVSLISFENCESSWRHRLFETCNAHINHAHNTLHGDQVYDHFIGLP